MYVTSKETIAHVAGLTYDTKDWIEEQDPRWRDQDDWYWDLHCPIGLAKLAQDELDEMDPDSDSYPRMERIAQEMEDTRKFCNDNKVRYFYT